MNMFPTAFRALGVALFVFREGEDQFKRLLAIFAIEFVVRHGETLPALTRLHPGGGKVCDLRYRGT